MPWRCCLGQRANRHAYDSHGPGGQGLCGFLCSTYGCKAGVGDVLIGASAVAADCNGCAKASHIKDKLIEMIHLYVAAFLMGTKRLYDFVHQNPHVEMHPVDYSAVGRQVDFIRGAAMSKGGRSILAMPSTAAKGTVSRIVPFLDEGAAVTTSRNDVDYIVTEYGIAHLKGRTLRERALSLVNIAHPDFRTILFDIYKQRYY